MFEVIEIERAGHRIQSEDLVVMPSGIPDSYLKQTKGNVKICDRPHRTQCSGTEDARNALRELFERLLPAYIRSKAADARHSSLSEVDPESDHGSHQQHAKCHIDSMFTRRFCCRFLESK